MDFYPTNCKVNGFTLMTKRALRLRLETIRSCSYDRIDRDKGRKVTGSRQSLFVYYFTPQVLLSQIW